LEVPDMAVVDKRVVVLLFREPDFALRPVELLVFEPVAALVLALPDRRRLDFFFVAPPGDLLAFLATVSDLH
jgi:hypothetical protein